MKKRDSRRRRLPSHPFPFRPAWRRRAKTAMNRRKGFYYASDEISPGISARPCWNVARIHKMKGPDTSRPQTSGLRPFILEDQSRPTITRFLISAISRTAECEMLFIRPQIHRRMAGISINREGPRPEACLSCPYQKFLSRQFERIQPAGSFNCQTLIEESLILMKNVWIKNKKP